MILNEEKYKYINVNGKDIEILILEDNDNPNYLKSFMKDYPTVRAIVTDKYYFWKIDILHETISDKLKLSYDVENRFIIDGKTVDNSYVLSFYDMCLDFGDTEEASEMAQAWKKNYIRLKEKFTVSLSKKDEKLLNDICEDNIELDEDLNDGFWKWFGNSKVVDDNGQPLICYHGTNADINTFDVEKIGSNSGNYGHLGFGFYFSIDKREAEGYGKNIIKAYLKICNPFYGTDEQLEEFDDILDLPKTSNVDKNKFLNILKNKDTKAYKLAKLMFENGYTDAWDKFLKTEDASDNIYDLNTIGELIEDIKSGNLSEWSENKIKELFPELKIEIKPTAKNKSLPFLLNLGQYKDMVEEFTNAIKAKGYDGIIYGSEIVVFNPNQIKSVDNKGTWSTQSNNIYETLNNEIRKFL